MFLTFKDTVVMKKNECYESLLVFRAEVPMVAVFTFVDRKGLDAVIVSGDLGSKFGFLLRSVTYLTRLANPTARWLISLIRIKMFISICHAGIIACRTFLNKVFCIIIKL